MVLDGLLTILQSLFGWLFLLILQLLLKIVDIVESFFNVFAGTTEVYYYGEPEYLFNLFFTSAGITNLFWAMVIIAVILSFGFCIVAVARKVTDISGTTKHTLGQIISNFIRSLVVILLLNICIIAALNVTTVIFDRINYSLDHAATLGDGVEKTYTDEEFATMARILATIGNYSANPSAESRYNVNSCFNAIRGEMLTLYNSDCFNYDFPIVQEGKHSWQSALAQVAKSANLKEDLQLDTYYSTVQDAIILCFDQLRTNPNFKPQETAIRQYEPSKNMTTAQMIFLAASMGAEENEQFSNGSFDDALRRSYINGEKSIYSYADVFEDFSLREINYVIGIIVACCMILFSGKVILLFIVRMFNLVLLYVISPLFASSMALDEGSRFQNWTQSFIMQLLAAYGGVVMMRIYLLILPTVLNSNLQFFEPNYFGNAYNIYGQLFIVLAGSWAVSKASNLVSGALTGNASGAFQEAESAFDRTISENLGSGMLKKEFDRWRMNRDRAKSYAKGRYDKSLRPKDADDGAKDLKDIKKMLEGNSNRNGRNNMPKDDSGRSYSSLDEMKHDFRLDGNVAPVFSKESEDALGSSSLAKMRQDMGFESKNSAVFDGPVNGGALESSGNFDVDSLPDLGAGLKGKGKSPTPNNTKGGPKTSKTVSNTGSTKRSNTISTPPKTPTSKTVPTPPTSTGTQNTPLTGRGTTNTTSTGTKNTPLTGGGTTNTTSTGTLDNRQVGSVQTNANTNIASKLSSANGAATQTVQTQPLGGQTTGAAETTPLVRVRPSSTPTDNAKTREQLKSRLNNASKNN